MSGLTNILLNNNHNRIIIQMNKLELLKYAQTKTNIYV